MAPKRTMTAALAAVGLAVALPAAALATGSSSGYVEFNQGSEESLQFAVSDRSNGDSGTLIYKNLSAGFFYTAQVNCVVVSGNTATFSYVIPDQPQVPLNIRGLPVTFTVEDGPDEVGYAVAAGCNPAATNAVTGGFLQVTDR
jgi:hypothetical protein